MLGQMRLDQARLELGQNLEARARDGLPVATDRHPLHHAVPPAEPPRNMIVELLPLPPSTGGRFTPPADAGCKAPAAAACFCLVKPPAAAS